MAFLRSGKFFRFLSAGRQLVNFRDYESAHQLPATCVCSANNFASFKGSVSFQSLDDSLKRVDQEVRRSGRISRRDLEEILEEIRVNKTPTSSQSLLVIRCCGSLVPEELPEARTKIVQEIWQTFSKLKIPMDISHYNALLRVYLENEHQFSPSDFLAELQSKGVEPNRVTYQRLISRFCQQGDIDGATQILEFMREKQLPVNENVFNALIMGHSNADDLESAAGILGVMTNAGLELSADTYTTLLCGFAKKGDIGSINKYIDQCEEKQVSLLDKDYLEIVYTLAVNGHSVHVGPILEKLQKGYGYNQDAFNIILRLVNSGQEKTAMTVLKTMSRGTRDNGEPTDTGSFLIQQLIKANRPMEQIIDICNELESKGLNSNAMRVALEAALISENATVLKGLLKEMHAKGIEVRPHYFWPLFCSAKSDEEILEIASSMQTEFNRPPTNETIREYIVPRLVKDDNYEKVVQQLRGVGATIANAASAAAFSAIVKGNIAKAAEVMSTYDAYYSPGLFRKAAISALQNTKDYDSFVIVLRRISDSMDRAPSQRQNEDEENEHADDAAETGSSGSSLSTLQGDVVGDFILDAQRQFKNNLEVLQNILQGLIKQGISITSVKASMIQDRLGENMTEEISVLLGRMTSGELELVPFEKQRSSQKSATFNDLDVDQIEKWIANMEKKGESTKNLKRQLLVAAIRAKDVAKTEQVIERLKADGFILTSGVYAQLIELYASSDQLEKALDTYKHVRTSDPEFVIDPVKTITVALAFVNLDRIDDAMNFLDQNRPKEMPNERVFNYQSTLWRLLNSLAEKGKADDLNKLFDSLVGNGYFVPSNVNLGPLIKVHLVQNEVLKAIEKFEEVSKKYRATPWKNELTCRLINNEDAENLQKVTDLSTEVHGEVNSLYDLVFSFIECGRVRQARKILETPGLRSRTGRINYACDRFMNEGMPTALEGLVAATKDLSHIDRSGIYFSLLQTYIKEKETQKALGLWTSMQEEDVSASDEFLIQLSNFLTSQGHEVPFHVPVKVTQVHVPKREPTLKKETPAKKVDQPLTNQAKKKVQTSTNQAAASSTMSAYKAALKSGNLEDIYRAKDNLSSSDQISTYTHSEFIEALVKNDKLQEATKQVLGLLEKNVLPNTRIFCYYLNRLAATGDSETIAQIGAHLSSDAKKLLSFDNRVCHSYVVNGKVDTYLTKLEDAIDNAKTEEEITKAGHEFPRGGAIGILEKHPEYADRFNEVALKYAAKKVYEPMNCLWSHYFVMKDSRADGIFKKYLTDTPRLMFQHIVKSARDNQDPSIVENLIKVLTDAKISEGAIGNAYSCLLDIHSAKDDAEGCLKVSNDCVKDVCFENVNRTALTRAKACVEKAGKKFPHTIPEKKTANQDSSSSSSSSSSDDEVTKKKQS